VPGAAWAPTDATNRIMLSHLDIGREHTVGSGEKSSEVCSVTY
jgi:hypothetical protein